MTEPERTTSATFTTGDKVRHRASGELGIVTAVNQKCVSPGHVWCGLNVNRSACVFEPSGTYDLSIGFDKTITADGEVLELVEHVVNNEDSR